MLETWSILCSTFLLSFNPISLIFSSSFSVSLIFISSRFFVLLFSSVFISFFILPSFNREWNFFYKILWYNNTPSNLIRKFKTWFSIWSIQSPRFKNSEKYDSGLSCRWALFTAWAFGFKLHLIFHRVEFKNRFNILFGGFSWHVLAHSGFYESKAQHWTLILH